MDFCLTWKKKKEAVILEPVSFTGIALHSGRNSTITIYHNVENSGIIFVFKGQRISLTPFQIDSSNRTTCIAKENLAIVTVEHLLSALYFLNIRHAIVELINEAELPILDGSSQPFFESLLKVVELKYSESPVIRVERPFKIVADENKERFIELNPLTGDSLLVSCHINYPDSLVPEQKYSADFGDMEVYRKEIAPARTSFPFFCNDINTLEALKRRLPGIRTEGLDQNVNIYTVQADLNGGRVLQQIARHKILDFFGDIMTMNARIEGAHIHLNKSGHALNNKLACAIMKEVFI